MATRRGNREVRKPKQPKEKKAQAASTVSAIARRDLEQSGVSVPERAGPRECCPAAPRCLRIVIRGHAVSPFTPRASRRTRAHRDADRDDSRSHHPRR